MERIVYFKDYQIKEEYYSKKEIGFRIFLKISICASLILGMIYFLISHDYNVGVALSYYEFDLAIINLIILMFGLIFNVVFLVNKKFENPKLYYLFKLIFTVNHIIMSLLYLFLVMPTIIATKHFDYINIIICIFLYVLPSILLAFDFIRFDYNYRSKRYYSYLSIFPFFIYYLIVLFISKFSDITWQSYGIGFESIKMPYVYLDYNFINVVNNDYSLYNIQTGVMGMSTIFLLFWIFVALVGLSLILLHFKNKTMIKVYKIPYTANNVHQDI